MESSLKLVVGIGSSAGGLKSLGRLLSAVEGNTDTAYIVVQHLSPNHPSMMPELLGRHTHMPVHNVTHRRVLEPNAVYLVPPGRQPLITEGGYLVSDDLMEERPNQPITHFFRSLGRTYKERAVAIVLSGSGSDGSAGVEAVYDAGGLVMTEGDSAAFTSMPQSAVHTKKTHIELSPEAMPPLLAIYAENHSPQETLASSQVGVMGNGAVLSKILDCLKDAYGIDFSAYKQSAVQRRILRRLSVTPPESIHEYLELICRDGQELGDLYRDLLIGVTDFFRDPETWEGLQDKVLSELIRRCNQDLEELRVWVSGCSTGEEAYTAAQTIFEKMEEMDLHIPLRIFATDINETALRAASAGTYDARQVEHLSAQRRDAMFVQSGDQYIVRDKLRKAILFSRHNLLEDPPFARVDLTICRNLLIYFNAAAQRKAISALHFSLRKGGCLFLGNSESIGELESEYQKLHKRNLYRKIGNRRLTLLPTFGSSNHENAVQTLTNKARDNKFYEQFLNKTVGDAVIIDAAGHVKHLFGNIGDLLSQNRGPINTLLSSMCPGDLGTLVSTALKQARSTLQPISLHSRLTLNGEKVTYEVEAIPAVDEHKVMQRTLVRFVRVEENLPPRGDVTHVELPQDVDQRVQELEQELNNSRLTLQTVVEELEMTNEELQSSNEELHANLEELQSTNEELHSVNEELYSVNSEYEEKLKELSRSKRDQENLMRAIEAGVIFIDAQRCLRFFSPVAARFYNVMERDVGRDLMHITTNLRTGQRQLNEAINKVLEQGQPLEMHTSLLDGSDWSIKIKPYINAEQEEDGAVITLSNVTELESLRKSEVAQRQALKRVLDHVPQGIWESDPEGQTTYVNQFITDFSGVAKERILKEGWGSLLHPEDQEETLAQWMRKLQTQQPFHLSFRLRCADGSYRWVQNDATPMINPAGVLRHWYGSLTDIHDLQQAQERLSRFNQELERKVQRRTREVELSEHRLMLAGEYGTDGFWDWDLLADQIYLSPRFKALFGYQDDELDSSLEAWRGLILPEDRPRAHEALRAHLEEGKPYELELRCRHKDGSVVWVIRRGVALRDDRGRWVRALGTHTDITTLKQFEAELRKSHHQMCQTYEAIVERTTVKLWYADEQGQRTFFNDAWREHTGQGSADQWWRSIHPEERAKVRSRSEAAIKQGSPYTLHYRLGCADGSYKEVQEYAVPYYHQDKLQGYVGAVLNAEDAEGSYAQRLSVLAGGIAHDFNNILTGIVMPASLGKMSCEPNSPVYHSFDTIERSAHRAAELCRLLMDASGGSVMAQEVLDLEELARDSVTLLSASKRKSVDLRWDFDPALPRVEADSTQLQRVIMNLALNAIDALKGQPGDVIISAYSRSIPDQQPTHLVMHDHLARGDYAVLEIKDTGEGIPQSDLNRIFDPFFTTKATGRGLGLAAALGSIRALMGGIEVESTLGQGTSFRVWLPAAHADQPAPDQDAAASPDPGLSRDKSVLIIDDEPTINRMLARYCRSQGMQVFQLYNGVEAAEACRHHQPDVAIIDYSMPDVQGDELAAALRQVDPALPIILISGYSVEHMDATLDMDLFQGFLQKPFDFDTLEKTLAKLLKRDDDPSGG